MTRDEWKAICADMKRRVKRRIVLHCSTGTGEDKDGNIKRVGFTYRLSPIERAIRDLPRKGKYRRNARTAAAKLALETSRYRVSQGAADRLEESGADPQ